MTTYRHAPEVKAIADKLIGKHHRDLRDVKDRIRYVFRDEAAVTKGRTVLGKARSVGGLNAWLAEPIDHEAPAFYVMEIAEDEWEQLDDRQRVALVDHELCHFAPEVNDEGVWQLKIRAHDLEEFVAVVQRNGMWRPEIEHVVKVANEQLRLLDGGKEK